MKKGYLLLSQSFWSILIGVLLFPISNYAQGIYNNGANIVITNTSHIYISDNTLGGYKSVSSGTINNNTTGGTISLHGNWLNNAGNSGFSNDGTTVVFRGANQSIDGSSITGFYNLTALGSGTKIFDNDATVSRLVSVDGVILNANANLTLLATASANANVGPLLNGGSVTNNVIVQSYFTGGTSDYRGSRLISAPIDESGLGTKTYAQLKNFMIITGPGGATNGFDPGGTVNPNGATLTKYNESATLSQSQFTSVASITETFAAGKGVLVFYRGSRANYTTGTASTSNKVNTPYPVPENVVMEYTGPINQNNVVVNLTFTNNSGESSHNGYNLIGNPYPAVINWENVTRNNVANELKFIKPNGGYATYLDGVSTNSGGLDLRYIQPGQGFYTKATSNVSPSVTFTESSKSVSSTPVRLLFTGIPTSILASSSSFGYNFKNTSSSAPKDLLRMNLEDSKNQDEAVAIFQNGSNAKATQDDAASFGGSTVSFSTFSSDSVRLTINLMPDLKEVQSLRLSINAAASGPLKLNFTDLSATRNYEVLLKDSYLDTTVKVIQDFSYQFNIDRNVATSFGNNRFKLLFKPVKVSIPDVPKPNDPNGPVDIFTPIVDINNPIIDINNPIVDVNTPIQIDGSDGEPVFLSFNARKYSGGAELSWKSSSDKSVLFDVERADDGINFEKIGSVGSTGESNKAYVFTDKKPFYADNYYRIKELRTDSTFIHSNIVKLNYSLEVESTLALTVYPNPASEWISVNLTNRKSAVSLSIFNLQGKELRTHRFTKDQIIKENISDLLPGIYLLHITNDVTKEVIGKSKFIRDNVR